MKLILILAVCLVLSACGSVQTKEPVVIKPADKSKLFLQFPEEKDIQFFGKINVDGANSASGAIMYPAYGLAGFIAGVAAHAAIQGGIDSAEEKRKAELANQILEKYQSILSEIDAQSVVDTGLSVRVNGKAVEVYNVGQDVDGQNIFLAEVKPAFYLTQDEKSLILINELKFSESLIPKTKSLPLTVQYVSSPRSNDEADDYWQADDFANFKRVVRQSFLASIELGMKKNVGEINIQGKPQKTIRYLESGKKKVERGYVIASTCERIVFQTLRGAIKSVPVHRVSAVCVKPS